MRVTIIDPEHRKIQNITSSGKILASCNKNKKLRKRNKAIIAYSHTLLMAVTKASKQGQMCTAATNVLVAHIEYDKNNICGLKC